jgi:hypothetical protein
MLSAAHEAIASRYGGALADRLFRDNPRCIVEDRDIEPVPATRPVH